MTILLSPVAIPTHTPFSFFRCSPQPDRFWDAGCFTQFLSAAVWQYFIGGFGSSIGRGSNGLTPASEFLRWQSQHSYRRRCPLRFSWQPRELYSSRGEDFS